MSPRAVDYTEAVKSSASQGCGIVGGLLGIFFIIWSSMHGGDDCEAQRSWVLTSGIVQLVTGVIGTVVGCLNCVATCCIDPVCSDYDVNGEKTLKPAWKCTKAVWNVASALTTCGISIFGLAWLIYGIVLFLPTGYDGGFEGGCAELHKLGFVWIIICLSSFGIVTVLLPCIVIVIVVASCGAAVVAVKAVDKMLDAKEEEIAAHDAKLPPSDA